LNHHASFQFLKPYSLDCAAVVSIFTARLDSIKRLLRWLHVSFSFFVGPVVGFASNGQEQQEEARLPQGAQQEGQDPSQEAPERDCQSAAGLLCECAC